MLLSTWQQVALKICAYEHNTVPLDEADRFVDSMQMFNIPKAGGCCVGDVSTAPAGGHDHRVTDPSSYHTGHHELLQDAGPCCHVLL